MLAAPPSLCADVKPLSVSNRQIAYILKDSGTSQLSSRRCIFQLPVQRSTSCWCLPGTAADTAVKRFPTLLQTTSLSHQAEAVTHQTDAIMQRPGKVTVLPQICFENHRRTPAEAPNPLQQLKPRGNCRSNSAVLRDETDGDGAAAAAAAAAEGLPRQPAAHSRPAPTVTTRPPPAAPHAPSFPADPWGSTQAGHPLPERCPERKPPSGMPCAPLPGCLLSLLLLPLPTAPAPPAPRGALESRPDWWRREGRRRRRRERPPAVLRAAPPRPAAPSWLRPAPPRVEVCGVERTRPVLLG